MITDSFDNKTKPIISPGDFYEKDQDLVEICLVIFSRGIFIAIRETYDCVQIAEAYAANGGIPIYKMKYGEKEIAFYLSPIGSALAASMCIEVNWMIGAKKFIMFGSAGSLDRERTTGKFVVPTESYRDEGMSYHYAPPADYIKVKNHGTVAKIFEELHYPYTEGRIWTTDAMLRETEGQMLKRKEEGCIAVEMEVAGVQAVCDFHGFELYNFLVTGDVLELEHYEVAGLGDANHNMDKFYAALKIAERI